MSATAVAVQSLEAPRVLLVAGPSGAGKSTFVRQFLDGELPEAIARRLPAGARSWPVIDVTNTLRRQIAQDGIEQAHQTLGRPPAFILHYDIVSVFRFGWPGYGSDVGLRLAETSRLLDVVVVSPSADRLRRQFFERDARRQQAKPRSARLWNRAVLQPMRQLLGTGSVASERDLYRQEGWLERCLQAWDTYLAGLVGSGTAQSLTRIEPCSGSDGRPMFRLRTPVEAPSEGSREVIV